MREAELMRYSVKCSMTKHAAITKAAARAGLSVNQFVQAHFETILDERRAAKADDAPQDLPKASASGILGLARRFGLTVREYKAYHAMHIVCDADGLYCDGIHYIAAAIDIPAGHIGSLLDQLRRKGAISNVSKEMGKRHGYWQLHPLVEVAA